MLDRCAGTEGRARSYHRSRLRVSAGAFALTAAYLGALIATGAAVNLRDGLAPLAPRWWLELMLALGVLGGGHWLLTFPLAWLGGFCIPRHFGLLEQPFHRWLWDQAKAALVGGLLGLVGAEIVYALLHATSWWWLWGAGAFLAAYALLAWITPVFLVPLFYHLAPLTDIDLRDRLLRLAAAAGVPALGVWVADQSRKSRTANAAVVGFGSTRRIVLTDTLLKELSADEVEAVIAHELAHHAHGDMGRGLLVQGAITLATFWAAARGLGAGTRWLGLTGADDLAGLPLFGLIIMGAGLVALPLANGWSRRVEQQADDFAVRATGKPSAFISAMERLGHLNLAERDPHPWKEFLLYSHPSIGRRVARARSVGRFTQVTPTPN
jgi:Zn-dependent protease with chaperone function